MTRTKDATALADELTAKAAVSYLIEHIEYHDNYGVHGSDFMACLLCRGGGAPGVNLVHEDTCPVSRCEKIAAEWVEELNAEREEFTPSASSGPQAEAVGYFCFVDSPRGEDEPKRIRAWTSHADRAKSIGNVIGRELQPLYAHPQPQQADGRDPESLVDRLRNPMWAHSNMPFESPQLEQEENIAAMREAANEIERLQQAEGRGAVIEALRPFAKRAEELDSNPQIRLQPDGVDLRVTAPFTLGDFRRAKAALQQSPATEGK